MQSYTGASLVPENERLTDVCKFSILKDEEIVFFAQRYQRIDDHWLKIIKHIDVSLDYRVRSRMCAKVWVRWFTLIKAMYGPTVSITEIKSELLVTSTLTQRFDFLRSMVSRSCFAATFEKFFARWAYVC